MQICKELAEYTLAKYKTSPSSDVRKQATAFLGDTFAVMLAGSVEAAPRILSEYANAYPTHGHSTAVSSGPMGVDAPIAALINGVAAHIHDYDDVCTTMVGHPSVAVLPAALAVAEELSLSGKHLLCSYIVGVEVCALIGRLASPELNSRGWHSTETIGIFGATAAAGCLYNLSKEQLINAFGIAASEACGLKSNYGTMTKSFHAGRACEKGIIAARLAKLGFTSSPDAFEGSSGFISTIVGNAHPDRFIDAVCDVEHSEFINPGLTMKPWPCCKGMHNAIWAAMLLVRENKLSPGDIDHVDCRVLPFAKDMLIYEMARTPLQGKFSMNYAIAKTILNLKLGLEDFEGDTVDNPILLGMMKRIKLIVDESLIPNGGYYDPSECEQVDIYLKDGSKYSLFCDQAKGTPNNPMSSDERYEKMFDCISSVLDDEGSKQIISYIEDIENIENVRSLLTFVQNHKKKR